MRSMVQNLSVLTLRSSLNLQFGGKGGGGGIGQKKAKGTKDHTVRHLSLQEMTAILYTVRAIIFLFLLLTPSCPSVITVTHELN